MIKCETDYAWAAGFIEGDGSFSLRIYQTQKRKMIQPVVQSSQIYLDPLLKLKNIAGNGTINNCRPWRIQITGKDVLLPFLKGISPYLCLKKRQCDILISVCEMKKPRGSKRRGRGGGHNYYSKDDWKLFFALKKEIEFLNGHKIIKR